MESHRIKVKLGDAEFDAEGKPEAVQAQYEAFLAAIAAIPKKTPETPPTPIINGTGALAAAAATVNGVGAVTGVTMDRVFRQGDRLSLAALPKGDNATADAMLALLYGYLKMQGEPTVTGTALMKSARISGISVDRIDRTMDSLSDFVLSAGVRKARRYQLNNRGLTRAEEVIKTILE